MYIYLFMIFLLTNKKILTFENLIATDLNYQDVIENVDTSINLTKFFNISKMNPKQIRIVFLNKLQQNKKFLEKNINKFTHLSTRWITFSVNDKSFHPKINPYSNDNSKYFFETEELEQEEKAIIIRGEYQIDIEFMEEARKLNSNIKIVPTFKFKNATERDILNLLTDDLMSKFMAYQMSNFCLLHKFDGIVLDMWSRFPIQSKIELWRLYKEISQTFKKNKLQLFIQVPSPINNMNEVGFFTKQDTEQLAPHVNGFILDTFDYSSDEIPGPTQPIKWLQRNIELLVPKQKSPVRPKLLVGISLHGNIFTPGEMKSLNGKVYLNLLKHHKPKLIWNDNWSEHYFNYKELNARNRAFYPSLASLKKRFLLLEKLNCGASFQFLEKGLPIFYNLLSMLNDSIN